MSGQAARGILDTSTVILLGELVDPSVLPDECVISTVTLAELSVGPHVATTPRERSARQAHLQQAEADFEALAFDAASARAFAGLQRRCAKPDASRPLAYEALIAASAIAHDLPLYTCNPSDFAGIDELAVQAVPNPRHR
jgi:tRNA(fMet)-specific endonuclease VapC